ncbi:HPP family protein [Magnetospirillum sp. UT-4]|uniref:HPP family protein n=1 Tax=Magnetospirillum sp. UT-4 TaxID=2681467 RepID=UPI0013855ABF|nr:HPP family protein [Magnetospirillum sp. UT-4]CAA7620734.1 conserved membrane hypothetical protein [Magnetospirillum sp. UT-4]
MRRFVRRHQPAPCRLCAVKAGIGGLIAIALCAAMAEAAGNLLLIAPLAASAVLVFGVHESPLAQPANVIGGHLLSTAIALVLAEVLPPGWWTLPLGVGLAIAAMAVARVTHPPAGADALVVLALHPGWWYLVFPILAGSVAIVLAGVIVHRWLPPRGHYPLPHTAPEP